MKTQIKKIMLICFLAFGTEQVIFAQCTNSCGVDAGTNKTSLCPGTHIIIGVATCATGFTRGCTYSIYWTPASLVVSGQGTCQPTVDPTTTTQFMMTVIMHGNCCCIGASGSCSTHTCDSVIRRDSMTVTVNSSGCRMIAPQQATEINNSSIQIFPNPTSGKLSIEMADDVFVNGNVSETPVIAVYDLNGRLVTSSEAQNKITEIDLSGLSKGMYFIRVISEENVLCMKKIVLH